MVAYTKLANVYDIAFGPFLQSGRRRAVERMHLRPGAHILEVGVGTGINLPLYPDWCDVTGVDLSEQMLRRARARLARLHRPGTQLLQMDATRLQFADGTFDAVYAPYTVSVVRDPVRVIKEMRRVCRPGGRIVVLNHFRSANPVVAALERMISPATTYVGFKADLDLPSLLAASGLRPRSIEKVNIPAIWSLVTCDNS